MICEFIKTCCSDPVKFLGDWFVLLPAAVLLLAAGASVVGVRQGDCHDRDFVGSGTPPGASARE